MPRLAMSGAASAGAFGFNKLAQAVNDAYFARNVLLLPGNGTNGAQNNTFLDSSSNAFSITRNGNTTQGTFSPFSQTGWSNYISSSDGFTFPSNAAFAFGTGAYTVEFWCFLPTAPSGNQRFFDAGTASGSFGIQFNPSNISVTKYGAADVLTSSSTVSVNQWQHVAIVRSGTGTNQTSIYINGVSVATGTDANNWTTTTTPRINGTGIGNVAGYFSNFRIVKGTAVYTGAFTHPTSPLTAISGTSFLICQGNRFVDASSNALAITPTGTPSVQAFSPFAPTAAYSAATNGGSGYFDGNGDSISAPNNTAFDMTGSSYCFEAWLYLTASSEMSIFNRCDGTGSPGLSIQVLSNQTVLFITSSTGSLQSTGTVKLNAWTHIACTFDGTTKRIFINGALDTSTTSNVTWSNASTYTAMTIGDRPSDSRHFYLQGYVGSCRIVKGSAVYTSAFTPATSPFTAISGTSLLLNFTNAGSTDATGKNVLETVGNAQISTTQSKWGGSSMYFDGTGDWAQIPNSQFYNFGTGDFTIECWLYPTAAGVGTIIAKRSGSNTAWLQLYYDSTNKIGVVVSFNGTTWGINSLGSTTVSLNTWTHVALVRNGSSFKTYINGTADISATDTGSINFPSDAVTIGAGATSGIQTLTGYIDDMRISRFARYTANFTPPTQAFALQ